MGTPVKYSLGQIRYNNRTSNTNKDARLKNCYIQQQKVPGLDGKDEIQSYIVKRPGITTWGDGTAITTGKPIGLQYYRNSSNDPGIWAVFDNTDAVIYFVPSDASATDVTGLFVTTANTTLPISWAPVLSEGRLYFHDHANLYTSDGTTNAVTQITDADLPTAVYISGLVSLDSYLFIGKVSGGRIYNSDLNTGLSWTSGNFLTDQSSGDTFAYVGAIIGYKNYLISFKQNSINFFYDAANAAGSPLAVVEGARKSISCFHQRSIAQAEDIIVFAAKSTSGKIQIVALDGLTIKPISDPFNEKLLESISGTAVSDLFMGELIRIDGNILYLFNITNTAGGSVLVFDIGQKQMYEWQSSLVSETNASQLGLRHFIYNIDKNKILACATYTGHTGKIYELTTSVYQDISTAINFEVVTPNLDFSTNKKKFMTRLTVIGDEQTSTSNMTIEWSDDDYQTWSTARTVDLSKSNPTIYNLGSFVKRAFRLKSTANTPIRLESLEFDIELGDYVGGNV